MRPTSLSPLPASLATVLAAAHFWRCGLHGAACLCIVLALLVWTRLGWVRCVLGYGLVGMSARWVWLTGHLVGVRQAFGEPWVRLACILGCVALFTLLAALPLLRASAAARWNRGEATKGIQAGAFLATAALLGILGAMKPDLFLLERFLPGMGGALFSSLPAFWAAWVAGLLADRKRAQKTRLRIWQLFSLAFFGQVLCGILFDERFFLSGELHLPVPGLILSGVIYRGGGYFMLGLFGSTVLLAGAAWCSHLCYLGVWDATCAQSHRPARIPSWMKGMRIVVLLLALVLPALLRMLGTPVSVAVAAGIALGLALPLLAALYSRKAGIPGYCMGICPLGTVARMLGRISPWRIHATEECTGCGACAAACRYGAMEGRPGRASGSCTLCRACLASCAGGHLGMAFLGRRRSWVEPVFVGIVSVLHTLFLSVAMM